MKHFNLYLVLATPFILLFLSRIDWTLALLVFLVILELLIIRFDDISADYDEREVWKNE